MDPFLQFWQALKQNLPKSITVEVSWPFDYPSFTFIFEGKRELLVWTQVDCFNCGCATNSDYGVLIAKQITQKYIVKNRIDVFKETLTKNITGFGLKIEILSIDPGNKIKIRAVNDSSFLTLTLSVDEVLKYDSEQICYLANSIYRIVMHDWQSPSINKAII